MELILTFQNLGNTRIPINYQYYLSSWLYDIVSKGDKDYAAFLHEKGYAVEGKQLKTFKHFCFSWLDFEQYGIDSKRKEIEIQGNQFQLKVRFFIDEAMKHFVKGLFKDQMLTIKSGYNKQAVFITQSVDMAEVDLPNGKSNIISAKTPLVIGKKQENGNDEYLHPLHEDYQKMFFINLMDKYKATDRTWKDEWNIEEWKIDILTKESDIKSKKITLKPGTKDIDVRGYLFDFALDAPPEVIEIGMMSGFGKHCASGFGFGEVIVGK